MFFAFSLDNMTLMGNIVHQRHIIQKIVILKDKADVFLSKLCQLFIANGCQLLSIQYNAALCRLVNRTQQIQKRTLPRPAGTHDRDEIPFLNIQ